MKRYHSSSESDDDAPIIKATPSVKYQVITKRDLLESSVQKCEFCDAVFYNKYKMLIHNASHIIIPLLKQSIPLCTKCNIPFESTESLEKHEFSKHLNITNQNDYPVVIPSLKKKQPYAVLTKEEFVLKEELSSTELLKSFCKQPVTVLMKEKFQLDSEEESVDENCENKLLESLVNKNPITMIEPLVLNNVSKINDEIIDISDDSNSMGSDNKSYLQESRIKDRILFEEEVEDDNIFPTTKVEETIVNSDVRGTLKMNTIVLGKHPSDSGHSGKSIHYDELVKPGYYKCKKCTASFPNRYNLILHDTYHLRFKRRNPFLCRMCDWYVSSNRWGLKAHQNACHPGRKPPTTELTQCSRCNLKYAFYDRHMRNYHNIYKCRDKECKGSLFNSYDEYLKHRKENHCNAITIPKENNASRDIIASDVNGKDQDIVNWYSKTVKVCDLCLLFLKNKPNVNYKLIEIISEVGVRHTCDQCGSMFFELNLISKISHRVFKKRAEYGSVKKKVTNEERLKSVQRRLKNLKFMNKF